MTAADTSTTILELVKAFESADHGSSRSRKVQTSPFSMRLSEEERRFLDEHAGNQSWAAYIRECVFGEQETRRRSPRRPKIEDQQMASLLSALGHSRLSSNLNQLAKSANMGTLDVSPDTEQQLQEAAMAVLAMRDALFTALGLKPQ